MDDSPEQPIIINQQTNSSNSIGTIGFVLAILSWVLSCFPVFGFIIWFLGALLSIIGLFRRPRGFAIAGVIISFIGLIILILLVAGIFGLSAFTEGFDWKNY